VPALTPYVGFVFELNNIIQAGVFCGWDYLALNDDIHFIYHGKTWISFGLGYSLISFNEEKPDLEKRMDRKIIKPAGLRVSIITESKRKLSSCHVFDIILSY
jgi:hypothetical protein